MQLSISLFSPTVILIVINHFYLSKNNLCRNHLIFAIVHLIIFAVHQIISNIPRVEYVILHFLSLIILKVIK